MKNITLTTLITLAAFLFGVPIYGQMSGGSDSPKKGDTSNTVDSNLRSVARVNPTTLAMEFSLPLASYPGRGGNSLPIGINYSSKLWQMKSAQTWWYGVANNGRRYVTDTYNRFAEMSAGGWTSSLQPPRLEAMPEYFNVNGRPYGDSLDLSEAESNYSDLVSAIRQFPQYYEWPTGTTCVRHDDGVDHCTEWIEKCFLFPDSIDSTVEGYSASYIYYIKRLRIIMPDGTSHEFLQNNTVNYCGTVQTGCTTDYDGTYLATDGSGMRLEYDHDGLSTLHTPDGGKYTFPAMAQSINGHFAETYIDANGNKTSFTESFSSTTHKFLQKTTDTMGREIHEPIPHNWITQTQVAGTENIELPGIGTDTQDYQFKWENLRPIGCEASDDDTCVGLNEVVGGALEDQREKLFYESRYFCQGSLKEDLLANPNDYNDPENEVLFPITELGIRPCNGFGVQRDENGDPVLDENGNPNIEAVRFNPVVLSVVTLPNGQKYTFKYNRFGEISKIIYPSGSYETFAYAAIDPLSNVSTTHNQMNRGVTERRVYDEIDNLQQRSTYQAERTWTYPSTEYKITTIASTGSNAFGTGAKTVRYVKSSGSIDSKFGFSDPLVGMPYDERAYDENGEIRSRVLTEYTTKDESTWNFTAQRDVRRKRTLSISFEGTQALATLTETDYDESGSTNAEHFSHLNQIRQKGYHYVALTASSVDDEALSWSTITGWFSGKIASVSETDYAYDSGYEARGITSLPIRTLTLDPANPDRDHVLAKTETIYDNALPNSNSGYGYSLATYSVVGNSLDCSSTSTPKVCWQNPNGVNGNLDLSFRGLPTTNRVWVKETNTWIETHTQYDQFGNAVKAKDPIGNEASTVFAADFKYAYPTSVTTPAPDPTNTTGTNQTSTASTTYDFNTGLPLSVTDDFGQVSTTEYNDPLLRPTQVNPVVVNGNPTGPVSETIYGTPDINGNLPESQRFVKVRKQLDATNWDEATTWFDSLGRTVKTVAKDSQGDVIVETHYDLLGRVDRVTNPYRANETAAEDVLWSKTRYDEAGRAVESYAPETLSNLSNAVSLGVTSYDISNVTDHVGTVFTTTDASGRKSRSITNALGQLTRVDEPTGISASADTDLGALATPTQATTYKYDAFGKMVEVTQGVQHRYFKYDALGRLLRVRQPEQEVNANLATSGNPNNNDWTAGFAYDLLGNVVRATDANGVNIINDYDRAGRVTKRCYSKPNINTSATTCGPIESGSDKSLDTPSVSFFYDGINLTNQPYAKGKLTKVTSSISTTEYVTFDNFGRLTRSKQTTDGVVYGDDAHPMTYTYNLSGALIEEKYPSGRVVQNEFESDGDISRIYGRATANSTDHTYAASFSYTPDGKIARLRLGNGLWEAAQFNSRMQPTEIALGHGVASGDLWKLGYEYGELNTNGTVDANKNTGNIARQTVSFNGLSHPFVQSYKYDALYRLKEAKETKNGSQTWIQEFGYDLYGNRTSTNQSVNGSSITTTPVVDANTNRFTSTNFQYDKNGNITHDLAMSNQLRTFVFNADNKQRQVLDANNDPIGTYYYDGEGKRVKKVTETETTIYVYSGGKLVAEYSTATPPANPSVNYTATDLLGSPRVLTNSLGEVVSRRDFLPFGEELYADGQGRTTANKYTTSGQDGVRKRFTGYEKDVETQLDFAEARMYENRYGRFTAVDPLLASGKSGNPQTFNRYVYVLNNPLILTDPAGLQVTTSSESSSTILNTIRENVSVFAEQTYEFFTRTFSYKGDSVTTTPLRTPVIYETLSNSDSLQNANFERFLTVMNLTTGNDDGGLSRRLVGNRGPTVFSVLQQATDSYKAAQTIGEINLAFQSFYSAGTSGYLRGYQFSKGVSFGTFNFAGQKSSGSGETSLIGVPQSSLDRLSARLSGLNIGGKKVFSGADAFGSRAGSTYRGRGPLPESDLDVLLKPDRPLSLFGNRNLDFISRRLNQIGTDFQRETGFPVNFKFDSPFMRKSIQFTPFVPIIKP